MNTTIADQMIAQLDDVLEEGSNLQANAEYDDLSDLSVDKSVGLITRARAVIQRVAGKSSVYDDQCEQILRKGDIRGYEGLKLLGVVASLRTDVEKGYLKSQRELIHGELFGDFLEMAEHLLEEGYKDAAAVIAGSSLESHLRQLCHKSGIATEAFRDDKMVPKKAAVLNTELTDVYAGKVGDQKKVTAWLDLRNHAAHGDYESTRTAK